MKGPFLLLALSFKRARTLLLVMGALLWAFQILFVLIAKSIGNSGQFEQLASMLPPFVRTLLGPSLASVMSFRGVACMGFYDLGIIIALIALTIALSTLPASEIESGFADLILARPMRRHWLITRTIVLVSLTIVLMMLAMIGGTWFGLETLAPPGIEWPATRMISSLAVNLGALLLSWSGIAMALGAVCRRGAASAVTGILARVMLLLEYCGQLWPPIGRFVWLSPFHYFIPFDLAMGKPLPINNLLVLFAIAVTGYILAYFFMSKRDIAH